MTGWAKTVALALAIISLTTASACGEPSADFDVEEDGVAVERHALSSDPWETLFFVRPVAGGYMVNAVGPSTFLCLDGVARLECPVDRLNIARTNLQAATLADLQSRVALETADETKAALMWKGTFVNVRDHRNGQTLSYTEFRATAAYRAPNHNTHSTQAYGYVTGPQLGGYFPVKSVNADFLPGRVINITNRVTFNWVGLVAEPGSYRTDDIVAVKAYHLAAPNTLLGPFVFDIDQRFRLITQ